MRRLTIIILCLLLAAPALGQIVIIAKKKSTAVSYLISEDFDGSTECASSYTSTCDNAWTVTKNDAGDTVDFDNAATPAPLEGTYSLRITSTGSNGSNTKISYSNQSFVSVYMQVEFDVLGATDQYRCFMNITSSADADLCAACLHNSEAATFVVYNGSSFGNLNAAPSVDTKYHVWLEYTASGNCDLFYSTDGLRPGSATSTVAAAGATQAGKFAVMARHSADNVFDKIRLDNEAIGSSPD